MDNIVFKQSVMGFNRTQVLEYIDTLVKQLKEQETEYTQKQKELESEIVALKKDTFSLKTRCELLSAENEGWKRRQDKIGECLIEANIKAEEIIRNAEQQAEQTKQAMAMEAQRLSGDVVNLKEEIARVEAQLEQSFAKLQNAMATMDSSAKTIEQQVDEYKSKIDAIETDSKPLKSVANKDKKVASLADTYYVKPVAKTVKKSLTDSVLDTIQKIIG